MSEHAPLQAHHTVQAVAEAWGLSEQTVIRMFQDEPGVLRIRAGRKGRHTTWRISDEALRRVYARLTRMEFGVESLERVV